MLDIIEALAIKPMSFNEIMRELQIGPVTANRRLKELYTYNLVVMDQSPEYLLESNTLKRRPNWRYRLTQRGQDLAKALGDINHRLKALEDIYFKRGA